LSAPQHPQKQPDPLGMKFNAQQLIAKAVFETLEGWRRPLDDGLPDAARAYVELIERELDVPVRLVGTGAERERVLARH